MHYQLPADQPPIVLVGPDDTEFWAALGEPAAHRHALVIGDQAQPDTATVVTGELLDLAGYLDPFTDHCTTLSPAWPRTPAASSRSTSRTSSTQSRPRRPRRHSVIPARRLTRWSGSPCRTAGCGSLPSSRGLRVSSYRALATRDGQAFNAVLRLDRTAVGHPQHRRRWFLQLRPGRSLAVRVPAGRGRRIRGRRATAGCPRLRR
ncbi:hypothetical protein [Dactylosporangium sp. NPDC048998]|uniref:hypothetical protein n=1 Tax=Dactylosporangium sp. NPDC048998 TaxID=3363976 RepID=UPI003712C3CD